MRVAVDVLGPVKEPYMLMHDEQVLVTLLSAGSIAGGLRPSDMTSVTYDAGEMILCHRHVEHWVQASGVRVMYLAVSDATLRGASGGIDDDVELLYQPKLVDARLGALVAAVNEERMAGFPGGQLFLDSVEQALAVALVNGYAARRPSPRTYRGGLTPTRLRRVTELVHARIEDNLSLDDMAQAADLSTAHFAQMFRKSTGESPHQFVLRQRIERAKEMLRTAEARVLDVAVACGFKTQQHFARVFRQLCGASPTEYRYEFQQSRRPAAAMAYALGAATVDRTASRSHM